MQPTLISFVTVASVAMFAMPMCPCAAQQQIASGPLRRNEPIKFSVASEPHTINDQESYSVLTIAGGKLVLAKSGRIFGHLRAEILLSDDVDFVVYSILQDDGGRVLGVDSSPVQVRRAERSRVGMTFRDIAVDFGTEAELQGAERLTLVIQQNQRVSAPGPQTPAADQPVAPAVDDSAPMPGPVQSRD